MNSYPEVVAKIANDYLERVKSQLRLAPIREQNEFLAEIESHMYEAYQQGPEEDDVARILAVLRNLGEPAEVVSDGLPRTMTRSGAKRNLPLYIVGGILIGLFGIPLGFGGLGVLVGILAALAGIAVAFYATVGSVFLTRMLSPQLFDRLAMLGIIHINAHVADFLDQFPRPEQNLMIVLFGAIWLAVGLGMLWLGRYLFRGLRFLLGMLFSRTRRLTQGLRGKLRQKNIDLSLVSHLSPAKGVK